MTFTIGLAQVKHPQIETVETIAAQVDSWAAKAAARGVDVLVFPEAMMGKFDEGTKKFPIEAQPLDGEFCKAIDAIAKKYSLWIVYTTNELNPAGHPFNTAVITNSEGAQVGSYRKVHLFDTDILKESDRIAAGDKLFEPVKTPFGKIGLSICYDIRFPEVARSAALAGCQLFINPAAWVDGNLKAEQWEAMLKARAIENQMFVAGLSRCDDDCIGDSCIYGPCGMLKAQGGRDEELVCAEIDTSKIEMVSSKMPLLAHRRPELY